MFEQFYKENERVLQRRVLGRGIRKQDSGDVLQEACANALQYENSFNPKWAYGQWFNTILNNAIRKFKIEERLQGMARTNVKMNAEEHTFSEADINFKIMLCEHLEREIEGREQNERDVLYLYFLKEVAPADILNILEVKKTTMFQIIKDFRKEMGDKYNDV